MYAQIFFVTSVRGNFFAPQIAASSGLRTFGAKMPFPAFFMAASKSGKVSLQAGKADIVVDYFASGEG